MSETRDLLEMRLKKFLHYGSEQPIYKAGDRFHQNCYKKEHVPSLLKLIDEDNPESIVDIILKVNKEGTSLWPDSLTFALAVCAQQTKSLNLQRAAYQSVRAICKTARDIILFVKFFSEIKGKSGGGNGFKRAIAQWYLVWMPFDLADIFLHQSGYFGWKHADVLRIAHVKPISIEQQLLFTYVQKGLGAAANQFGDNPNEQVIELLEYINSVESFKRLEKPDVTAKALSVELHGIERVPNKMLKHQEVWNELIPNLDVETLLDNMQRISTLGFLKNNNVTVMKVQDVLNNIHKAENFKHHPTRVFIEHMTYEKAATYCLGLASLMNHPISNVTPSRKPPKRNILIKNALMKFFYSLYKFQKPTELRYFVAVDIRPKMFSDRCYHCIYLNPIEAAQAICLSLMRTEQSGKVKVGAFVDAKGRIELLNCEKEWEITNYDSAFKSLSSKAGPASVVSAIHWAETNEFPADVFVILSNFSISTKGTRSSITSYRTNMNLPNSKLITCSLTGVVRSHKDVEGQNMQCVIGFDEHICRLIEVFARGAF